MNEEINDCILKISNFPTLYKTENLSPLNIIKQSGYFKWFSRIDEELIVSFIASNPVLVDSWIQYTEDIRHSPAWGFGPSDNGKWIVALWGKSPVDKYIFDDKIRACAKMIKLTAEDIRTRNV
jgi:hypothetical protein